MNVVGIGYFVAHDSNAALVSGEEIKFACSEERLSRRKRDGSFPKLCLQLARPSDKGEVVVAAYNDHRTYEEVHKGIWDGKRRGRFALLQREHEKALREVGLTEFL